MKHSVAIFSADGIGDAILLQVIALLAKKQSSDAILFHPQHAALQSLFPDFNLEQVPSKNILNNCLETFDQIFVQNDHGNIAFAMDKLRRNHPNGDKVIFIHPKDSKLEREGDIAFSKNIPFATNLINKIAPFFPNTHFSKTMLRQNFKTSNHRQHLKNVAIHPTSQDKARNWPPIKFIQLKHILESRGFHPYFIVHKDERKTWLNFGLKESELPLFPDLKCVGDKLHQTGYFIGNDSGIGHLASMLAVPSLTISNNKKRVVMWRPDFCKNRIITPSLLLPNFKGIGLPLRQWGWHYFVSVAQVERIFNQLVEDTP